MLPHSGPIEHFPNSASSIFRATSVNASLAGLRSAPPSAFDPHPGTGFHVRTMVGARRRDYRDGVLCSPRPTVPNGGAPPRKRPRNKSYDEKENTSFFSPLATGFSSHYSLGSPRKRKTYPLHTTVRRLCYHMKARLSTTAGTIPDAGLEAMTLFASHSPPTSASPSVPEPQRIVSEQ